MSIAKNSNGGLPRPGIGIHGLLADVKAFQSVIPQQMVAGVFERIGSVQSPIAEWTASALVGADPYDDLDASIVFRYSTRKVYFDSLF